MRHSLLQIYARVLATLDFSDGFFTLFDKTLPLKCTVGLWSDENSSDH